MLPAVVALMSLGLLFGAGLAFASRVLEVKQDERIEAIEELLPGANCGACGFAGCANFSEAVVHGDVEATACPVSGPEVLERLGDILGEDLSLAGSRKVAKVRCRGHEEAAKNRFSYAGIPDCDAAEAVGGGHKACEYGCLGQGTCVRSCPFDAMEMSPEGLAVVDEEKCTACGNCVEACPRDIIEILPEDQNVFVMCTAELGPRDARKVCDNSCLGCGLCARRCPQDAIVMKDQLPVIDFDKCDGCGVCIEACPTDALYGPPERLKDEKTG